MTELLDGRQVPWHFVSGETEPSAVTLPPPVRREPIAPIQINPELVQASVRFNQAVGVFVVNFAEATRPLSNAMAEAARVLATTMKTRR